MPKYVVITTEHRGVFAGIVSDEAVPGHNVVLEVQDMRNCVYWTEKVKGFIGLAVTGPVKGCRIGPAVPVAKLSGITSILDCTPEAQKAWESDLWA